MDNQITPFGAWFRGQRKKRGQNMDEAAELLGVSKAYVSAVEHGDRQLPGSWEGILVDAYRLDGPERSELEDAIRRTPRVAKITTDELYAGLMNMVESLAKTDEERKRGLKAADRLIAELLREKEKQKKKEK